MGFRDALEDNSLHNQVNKIIQTHVEKATKELIKENQELKEKIDFYEGELHRRGYVIQE